jgi:hypothetical protein
MVEAIDVLGGAMTKVEGLLQSSPVAEDVNVPRWVAIRCSASW